MLMNWLNTWVLVAAVILVLAVLPMVGLIELP